MSQRASMSVTSSAVAQPDLKNLPRSSVLRLYDPETWGNSFSLDGFPAVDVPDQGQSPSTCLPAGQGTVPGQPHWLTRLIEIIEGQGAIGMTTNQTLFRTLLEAGALDERLKGLRSEGQSAGEIYRKLYNEAATLAGRAFGAIHARWPWEGRVSQEASALLTELDPLVRDVQRIARAMEGIGAFTKIPNLPIGPQAIQRAVSGEQRDSRTVPLPDQGQSPSTCLPAGLGTVPVVHPNVTLVFSDRHYLETVEGYLLGLNGLAENLKAQGFSEEAVRQRLGQIHSVNSLFVSRVDRVVDPMIEERLRLLKGKVAVAQAKKVYQIFQAVFLGAAFLDPEGLYADEEGRKMVERIGKLQTLFAGLKSLGANPQRLLIASSGVKSEQPYSRLLYVLPFLGPWCANTLPEGTLAALSRFVAERSDEELATLKGRNLMAEPLPEIPTDLSPTSRWDRAVLMSSGERQQEGIPELSADRILRQAHTLVFEPQGTSLRKICDAIRDRGAQAFTADEQATLQAIESRLQRGQTP